MSIKRITLLILGAAFILFVFQGCRLPLKPIPGPGRNGRFYCYTEDYPDRHFPFCLLGKSLTASKGDGSWEFLPPPTAIFPGYPLFWLERYIICPVVDTVMIPYDLYLRKRNANVCARDGYYVRIIDYAGQAVQDVDIEVIVDARYGYRIIYDGQACAQGFYSEKKKTDENGELYIPIDITSCSNVRFSGRELTSVGTEAFEGFVTPDGFASTRIGDSDSRCFSLDGQQMVFDVEHPFYRCPRCTSGSLPRKADKWDFNGVCVICGKRLTNRMMQDRLRFFLRWQESYRNARPPILKKDYEAICKQTGLTMRTLEGIYGTCAPEDGRKRIVVRLRGKIADLPSARNIRTAGPSDTNLEQK